ncbi:uncharacterized protein LOC131439368 [Malaya genurostris]|uniref:uncharacterized protein LOC131439368 n=1 Tax=Malaya genurostris TaxID=325434 RepID=UPI0026F3A3B8|nr:uncharacterized protein LOC131439368 [Malaya genurostris]
MALQLVTVLALICLVSADVSELLRESSKLQDVKPVVARSYAFNAPQVQPLYYTSPNIRYNNHASRFHLYDSIIVDQPVAVPYTVFTSPEPTLLHTKPVAVETVIDANTGIAYQLSTVRSDLKVPYYYSKPKKIVEYVTPVKPPTDDYLPPLQSNGKSNTV